jgi:hypothetical protein
MIYPSYEEIKALREEYGPNVPTAALEREAGRREALRLLTEIQPTTQESEVIYAVLEWLVNQQQ